MWRAMLCAALLCGAVLCSLRISPAVSFPEAGHVLAHVLPEQSQPEARETPPLSGSEDRSTEC